MRLAGKTALITGGTSGIGRATVEAFLREGANVAFTGRSLQRGAEVAESRGDKLLFIPADVRRESEIEAAVKRTVEHFGQLDILFNNAGGPTYGDIETITYEQYTDALDLLLGSVVFGMKHAVPIMRTQGRGSIINNSSVAALRCNMGGYMYSAAKAAVTHISRLAGMELAPSGIRINTISPGGIMTPIFLGGSDRVDSLGKEASASQLAKVEAGLAKSTPMLRAGPPAVIADAAVFLASDEAAFVTCHDLVVDAGMTAAGKTYYADRKA